jgi:O-acetyl-ADP-ribose deacetylase
MIDIQAAIAERASVRLIFTVTAHSHRLRFDSSGIEEQEDMTSEKKPRATALIPWVYDGKQGILVHADRYKNTWILPGGGLELDTNGRIETPKAAVIRELKEETGLTAAAAATLFLQDGKFRVHHVFHIRPSGTLQIMDLKEAPAFGVCRPDFAVDTIMCSPDYSTDGLTLSHSTKKIIGRYQADYQQLGVTSIPTPSTTFASLTITSENGTTRVQIGGAVLELKTGDIVTQDVDAVVNAANEQLANGAGVCGALHRAAGARQLEQACAAILGGCPTGDARITPGFNLTARHVIHAVGPRYHQSQKEHAAQLLASAYRASLELASQHGLRSIAFPSLSTGIFGFPLEQATRIALQTVVRYVTEHPGLDLVRFVLRDDTRPIFEQELRHLVSSEVAHSRV